jgi:hypothetical protein
LWKIVYALDTVLPAPECDIKNEGQMRGLAYGFFVRSGRKMPGCLGVFDGMAVKIQRSALKDTPYTNIYFNQKGFYSLNLQVIADRNRKIVWWNISSVGSIHDNPAWSCIPLTRLLGEIGLPFGLWIAGDDAYPSNKYLLSPFSLRAIRADPYKNIFFLPI